METVIEYITYALTDKKSVRAIFLQFSKIFLKVRNNLPLLMSLYMWRTKRQAPKYKNLSVRKGEIISIAATESQENGKTVYLILLPF